MQFLSRTALVASVAGLLIPTAQATLVNPNVATGDSFSNATSTNTGQAVGSTGWYYNNVSYSGVVGIDSTYARSGNGSLRLEVTQGPGGASSKADVEFFDTAAANAAGNFSAASVLGQLNDLDGLSYDWYRDGSSTATGWLHPVIRLQITSMDFTKFGYLVFEVEYNQLNPGTAVPTDQWVTEDLFASSAKMWSTGNLPNNINGSNGPTQLYDARTIQQWVSDIGDDYYVLGVSLGVGSGWGTFKGAIDNVGWSFDGDAQQYNFELAPSTTVPEPASIVVAGLGLLALGIGRRRRSC